MAVIERSTATPKWWMVDRMAFSFTPEENWTGITGSQKAFCLLISSSLVDCEEMRNRSEVFEKTHYDTVGLCPFLVDTVALRA